ncbi:L-asparaginase 2 [Salmonella enterica subsp. enterica]|uniref:L-asparaginase 2 n=1 Tax=Salmonella enterica I TaxID=59201 RepID=A0A379WJK4_SALET|nr:L-asparaginase 2 [Salmonella enterica subsp. enterica]
MTVKSDKPVVFTAAMRPASAISADGARAARLVSDSLNPAKARVLLMTALTQTRNPELIQSLFQYVLIMQACAPTLEDGRTRY